MATQIQTVKVGDTSMNKVIIEGVTVFDKDHTTTNYYSATGGITVKAQKCNKDGSVVSMPYYCQLMVTADGSCSGFTVTWYACNQSGTNKYGPFVSTTSGTWDRQYVGSWNWIHWYGSYTVHNSHQAVTSSSPRLWQVQNGYTTYTPSEAFSATDNWSVTSSTPIYNLYI